MKPELDVKKMCDMRDNGVPLAEISRTAGVSQEKARWLMDNRDRNVARAAAIARKDAEIRAKIEQGDLDGILVHEMPVVMSARTLNCAANERWTLGAVLRSTDGWLLRTPNFGPKSLRELRSVLAEYMGMAAPPDDAPEDEGISQAGLLARIEKQAERLSRDISRLREMLVATSRNY